MQIGPYRVDGELARTRELRLRLAEPHAALEDLALVQPAATQGTEIHGQLLELFEQAGALAAVTPR